MSELVRRLEWLGLRAPSPTEEVTALFDEWRNPLLRYLLAIGLRTQDAEDVAQEVFLSLLRHLRDGKRRDNLRAWVFRVGHNLALKRRTQYARTSGEAPHRADPAPNPEQQAAWLRRKQKLQAVLDALPERDRCCLSLRAEGLRYREIADTLQISLGSVSASLARALAKLSQVEE